MSRSAFREALGKLVADGMLPPASGLPPAPPSSWNRLKGEETRAALHGHPQPSEGVAGGSSPQTGQIQGYVSSGTMPQDGRPDLIPIELPDFKRASDIRPENIRKPAVLIEGLLHLGCKMILAGGSKSFKSWSLIDLGLAIANGNPWWGMPTVKGNVLYINFELLEGFFEERILNVCGARNQYLPSNFSYWTLRAKCYDLSVIAQVLRARAASMGKIDLIIVDPLYKALGDLDENSASDMAELMRLVENLGDTMGAAIVFGAHFAKGNASGKEALDRAAGSGVFARDPDAILTMTRLEAERTYVVESELRYMAPLPKFGVRWEFPVMIVDEGLDPDAIYRGPSVEKKQETGAPFAAPDVLALLPLAGLQADAWKKTVAIKYGRAGKEFFLFKGELIRTGQVVKEGFKYHPANYRLAQQ